MFKTFIIFSVYTAVQTTMAVVLYYLACLLGSAVLPKESFFWLTGVPIVFGAIVCFMSGWSVLKWIAWTWKHASKDSGYYYE